MKAEALSWLQLEVSDAERSTRWYRRMLGLKPARGREGLLRGGGLAVALIPGTPQHARAFRFGLWVGTRVEVRSWRAHFDHNGGMPTPLLEQHGVYGFFVADPDGYVVQVLTDQPADQDL